MSAAHRAVLLPVLAAAFVGGLVVGAGRDAPALAVGSFTLGALLAVGLSASARWPVLPALAVAAALLGILRAGMAELPGAELKPYAGASGVQVAGVVADYPSGPGSALTFRLSAERLRVGDESGWRDVSGDIRVTARIPASLASSREPPLLRYGDRLILDGELEEPRRLGYFDFPAFLENRGIGVVMDFPEVRLAGEGGGRPLYRWLYSARREMAGTLSGAVHEPQAAFGQSILLGMRDNLPDSLRDDFRTSGSAHLLAISGLHVGVLLALSASASAFLLGRRRLLYLLPPLGMIWLYALMSGGSESAVRAAIMGSAYIAAIAVGRPRTLIPALALAAAVMAALDPRALASVSFQLSFAAMMGIAIHYEAVSERLREFLGIGPERDGAIPTAARALVDAIGVSACAILATAPLVLFYFERISLVGLPASLLTLPALPLALAAHGATALVGLASEAFAVPFGWAAWAVSWYITGVASLFASIPSSALDLGGLSAAAVWAYYILLAALALVLYSPIPWRRWASRSRRWRLWDEAAGWRIPAVAVALAATFFVWAAWIAAPGGSDGTLEVVFADVGQGDMAIVSTPGGHRVLVDGGPDGALAARRLGERMPFWDRTISLAILTHPHADHAAGLSEVLRRHDVRRVMERRLDYESAEYAAWRKILAESEGVEVVSARPGMRVSFDDGVELRVVGPPETLLSGTGADVDNASVAVRVVYGEVSFLFTGDMQAAGEAWALGSGQDLSSDVLKVAHHGSDTSSTRAFLEAVSPSAAVISAGRDNRFGHPSEEVVRRMEALGSQPAIFSTAEHGSATFRTDGRRLWVETER